jgi:hypothetical protein
LRQKIEDFFSAPISLDTLPTRADAILALQEEITNIKKNADLAAAEREKADKVELATHKALFGTNEETLEQMRDTLNEYQEAMGSTVKDDATSEQVHKQWLEFISGKRDILSKILGASEVPDTLTPALLREKLRTENTALLNGNSTLTDLGQITDDMMDLGKMLAIVEGNRESLQRAQADLLAKEALAAAEAKALEDKRKADEEEAKRKEEEEAKALEAKRKADEEAKALEEARTKAESLITDIRNIQELIGINAPEGLPKELPDNIDDLNQLITALKSQKNQLNKEIADKHQSNISLLNDIREQLKQSSVDTSLNEATADNFKAIRDQLSESLEEALAKAKKELKTNIAALIPVAKENGIDTSALTDYIDSITDLNVVQAAYDNIINQVKAKSQKKVDELKQEISTSIQPGSYKKSQGTEFNDTIDGFKKRIDDLKKQIDPSSFEDLAWHLANAAYNAYDAKYEWVKDKNGGLKALDILNKLVISPEETGTLHKFLMDIKTPSGSVSNTGKTDNIVNHIVDSTIISQGVKQKLINMLKPNAKAGHPTQSQEREQNQLEEEPKVLPSPPMNRKAQETKTSPITPSQLPPLNKRSQDDPPVNSTHFEGASQLADREQTTPQWPKLSEEPPFEYIEEIPFKKNSIKVIKGGKEEEYLTEIPIPTLNLDIVTAQDIINRMLEATKVIKTTASPFKIKVKPNLTTEDPNDTLWEYTDPFEFARHYIKGYFTLLNPPKAQESTGKRTIDTTFVNDHKNKTKDEKRFNKVTAASTGETIDHYKDSYVGHVLDLMLALEDVVDFDKSRDALSAIILDGVNALNYWRVVYSLRKKTLPIISSGDKTATIEQINFITKQIQGEYLEGVQVLDSDINVFNKVLATTKQSTIPPGKVIDTTGWESFFKLLIDEKVKSEQEINEQAIVYIAGTTLTAQRALALLNRSLDMRPLFTQSVHTDARAQIAGSTKYQRRPRSPKRTLRSKSPVKERKSKASPRS